MRGQNLEWQPEFGLPPAVASVESGGMSRRDQSTAMRLGARITIAFICAWLGGNTCCRAQGSGEILRATWDTYHAVNGYGFVIDSHLSQTPYAGDVRLYDLTLDDSFNGKTVTITSLDPHFAPFVTRITDGRSDYLNLAGQYPTEAAFFAGESGSSSTNFWTLRPQSSAVPDLQGIQIDHFNLTFQFEPAGATSHLTYTLSIFEAVPEPAARWLSLIALVCLAAQGLLRRYSSPNAVLFGR